MKNHLRLFGIILFTFFLFISCDNTPVVSPGASLNQGPVSPVIFTGQTVTVNFEDLNNNDIFLVRVNESSNIVRAANAGRILGRTFNELGVEVSPNLAAESSTSLIHRTAREFNANPPPINEEILSAVRSASLFPFQAPSVGETRMFYVEAYLDSSRWLRRQATLRATGRHANIWVMDGNYGATAASRNQITTAQAQSISNTFDRIYPLATNILGFEFGGGPGGHGGMDGDPKIQILIYDILDASGRVGAAGFFWAKDFFTQPQLDAAQWDVRTNLAEIFYLDASFINSHPDFMYSTLIHELQHMINFNMKVVRHGVPSQVWFNEMLSMMTEDIIAPLIGISPTNQDHVIGVRIPLFLLAYSEIGVAEWGLWSPAADIISYSTSFAFGAYLLRNFGGANLLRRILHNNSANIPSITAALGEGNPGMTFEGAFARYAEALVFSGRSVPQGALTLDKTYRSTVNRVTYTAYAFDIWRMPRFNGGEGPFIFDLDPRDMRPFSITLHSTNEWRNRSGNLSITLERPLDPNVTLFLMTR